MWFCISTPGYEFDWVRCVVCSLEGKLGATSGKNSLIVLYDRELKSMEELSRCEHILMTNVVLEEEQ